MQCTDNDNKGLRTLFSVWSNIIKNQIHYKLRTDNAEVSFALITQQKHKIIEIFHCGFINR